MPRFKHLLVDWSLEIPGVGLIVDVLPLSNVADRLNVGVTQPADRLGGAQQDSGQSQPLPGLRFAGHDAKLRHGRGIVLLAFDRPQEPRCKLWIQGVDAGPRNRRLVEPDHPALAACLIQPAKKFGRHPALRTANACVEPSRAPMNKQSTLQFHADCSDEAAIRSRQLDRGYRRSDRRINGIIAYLLQPGLYRPQPIKRYTNDIPSLVVYTKHKQATQGVFHGSEFVRHVVSSRAPYLLACRQHPLELQRRVRSEAYPADQFRRAKGIVKARVIPCSCEMAHGRPPSTFFCQSSPVEYSSSH